MVVAVAGGVSLSSVFIMSSVCRSKLFEPAPEG